jgi:hypothetical protein
MCPAMTFPATRNDHEIALTAVLDSVQSSMLLRSYSVQDNSWPTRAWTSSAPCRMPRCGTVVDESPRPVHVSHTMAMTQARCHLPAETLTA